MKNFNAVEDFLENRSFRDYVLRNDPKAEALMKAYLEKYPDSKGGFLQAKQILTELVNAESQWTETRQRRAFGAIMQRLDLPAGKEKVTSEIPRRGFATHLIALYSAVALIVGVGFYAYKHQEWVQPDKKTEENLTDWIVKTNPKGQKSRLHLPDGSSVVINSDSEIRYSSNFGKDHRKLFLTGEAYFEVASDSLLPFEVNSGGLIVVALGTTFNINSYSSQPVNVQLAEGSVLVKREEGQSDPVYLVPGEEVVWDGENDLKKRLYEKSVAFAWKDGRIVFNGHSWSAFRLALERWYGVEIYVSGPITKGLSINGTFEQAYLSDVLESIGYAYGFSYTIDQKKVNISFKPN